MTTTRTKYNVDKQHFLESTDDGFAFYEFVIEDLKKVTSERCENVLNPWYGDKNASFSIYYKDEMWCFHDHGDSSFSGDVFAFAAEQYNLDIKKDFRRVLHKMYEDLNVNKLEVEEEINTEIFELGYILPKTFNDPVGISEAYQYFKQFGITKEVLRRFGVRAIKSYQYIDKNNKVQEWIYKRSEIAIAYEDINHVKLYHPYNKDFKFQYRGNKPSDFVFGQAQIVREMIKAKRSERDILIIAAGEKDVMTLTAMGFDAICLNSETATSIPLQLENSILNCYANIVILYDLDDTGKKSADALQKKYGFKICTLPNDLKEYGGKDVSDYVRFEMNINRLKSNIIEAAGRPVNFLDSKDKIRIIKLTSGYINSSREIINNNTQMKKDADVFLQAKKFNGLESESDDAVKQMTETNFNVNDDPFIKNISLTRSNQIIPLNVKMNASPLFPCGIFSQLPTPLKEICAKFDDKRERDIILVSSLAVLSSLFPTLKSINDGRILGPNLNLFISAPAASGKGTANWAKKLGEGVHRHLKEKYENDMGAYLSAMQNDKRRGGNDEDNDALLKPIRNSFFIPANNSVSKVYEMLGANKRFGLIFETEGDTLTGALKAEWGNFSDVIRKCFHHETISLARRGQDELIEVENPHLSVLLTGTPVQINSLIQSVENGFFSRFNFYDFEAEAIWKSQFKKNDTSLHSYFQTLSEKFYMVWLRHEDASDTFVHIADNQKIIVDNYFEGKLHLLREQHGNDIIASLNRACVIWQRIAMILAALRHLETHKQLPSNLPIEERDGIIALKIVDVMLSHLQIVFARMKGSVVNSKLNHQQNIVWQALPTEFDRKTYDNMLPGLDILNKTGEKYLNDFKRHGLLIPHKHGHYRKAS